MPGLGHECAGNAVSKQTQPSVPRTTCLRDCLLKRSTLTMHGHSRQGGLARATRELLEGTVIIHKIINSYIETTDTMVEYKYTSTSLRVPRSKRQCYDAMVADGWILPSYQSRILTVDFLTGILNKEIYCPRREDVRGPCYVSSGKPTIAQLIETIGGILSQKIRSKQIKQGDEHRYRNLMGMLSMRNPNRDWLIILLYVVDPSYHLFMQGQQAR